MPTSQKIRIVCEVSKMDNSELRLKTVNALQEAKFNLSSKAFNQDATYSRFFSATLPIKDMSDLDEVKEVIERLYQKLKPVISTAEQVFKEVFVK